MARVSQMRTLIRDGRALFLACDQGFEHGPSDFSLPNVDPQSIVDLATRNAYTGLILLPGTAEHYYNTGNEDIPLIVKLNAKTAFHHGDPISLQNCSVRRAVKMNATAVGYTLYPGSIHEQEMYREFGRIVEEAHNAGLPVIAWAYPRGNTITNELDTDTIAYSARIAAELGADMIKLKYNHDPEGFAWIVANAGKAKILVSGGDRIEPEHALRAYKEALDAGASGIAVGRNAWQSETPDAFSRALARVVFENASVEDALAEYQH